MRRIIASLFTTVDGVVEASEQWHFHYFNEEIGDRRLPDVRHSAVGPEDL